MTTILARLRAKFVKTAEDTEVRPRPVAPDIEEIIHNDNFELSVFRDATTNGIVVRMGDSVSGRSIVVSGEAVMHAAGIVDKTFDDKKNSSVPRSLN